jgi:hypothetical protein
LGATFNGPGAAILKNLFSGANSIMNFTVHNGFSSAGNPCFVIDSYGV